MVIIYALRDILSSYLIDLSQTQDETQGHSSVGTAQELWLMGGRSKIYLTLSLSGNWAPQMTTNVINTARGGPRGVMVKAMDCGIVVREFVLQSRYYVHFRANTLGKGMNPLILPAIG